MVAPVGLSAGPSLIREMPGMPVIWVEQEATWVRILTGQFDVAVMVALLIRVEEADSVMK